MTKLYCVIDEIYESDQDKISTIVTVDEFPTCFV